MSLSKQNPVDGTDVLIGILIVALIVVFGWLIWGWFAWLFGAMNKWYPLGLREKIGFFVVGIGGAFLRSAGENS
jgi:predicted permease